MRLAQNAPFQLPVGQITKSCPAPFAKIFPLHTRGKSPAYFMGPVPTEGRFAIVTNVERDAVDADALLTNSA
jgi:hypothetical protein